MAKNIRLSVKDGAVVADENGKPYNKGNFCAKDGEEVKWNGVPADGGHGYVVKFRADSSTGPYGWPFSDPPAPVTLELQVPVQGQPTRTVLREGEALWKYEVRYQGAATLDPMIIVREANRGRVTRLNVYAVGAITFLAGVAVGSLLF